MGIIHKLVEFLDFNAKKAAVVGLVTTTLLILYYVVLSINPDVKNQLLSRESTVILFGTVAVTAAGLLGYLNRSLSKPNPEGLGAQVREINSRLAQLKSDFAALRSSGSPTIPDNTAVVEQLRASITDEIVSELENRLSAQSLRKAQVGVLTNTFIENRARLSGEIEALTRRGNVNLVIGVITTLFAAVMLAFLAINAPAFHDLPTLLSHYIPRVSTVIFIEVFSFFFLRLYKNTLTETKYYQNELTFLATLEIALDAATLAVEPGVMSKVIEQVVKSRTSSVTSPASEKSSGNVEYKDVADLLEKFAKIAVQAASKAGKD